MGLKWIDTLELAIELPQRHPGVDPQRVVFTELYSWILELEDFDDDPKHCGEKILEAVQMAWIDEMD